MSNSITSHNCCEHKPGDECMTHDCCGCPNEIFTWKRYQRLDENLQYTFDQWKEFGVDKRLSIIATFNSWRILSGMPGLSYSS